MRVLGGGALWRRVGHKGKALIKGISVPIKETSQSAFTPTVRAGGYLGFDRMPGGQQRGSHSPLSGKPETCLGSIPKTKPREAGLNQTSPK